MKKPTNKQAKA